MIHTATSDSALTFNCQETATSSSASAAADDESHLVDCSCDVPIPRFGVERLRNGNNNFKYFTGFKNYELFQKVYSEIEPCATHMITYSQVHRIVEGVSKNIGNSCTVSLPLVDQFFLFLHKVRLGTFDGELAEKFNISLSTVSRI